MGDVTFKRIGIYDSTLSSKNSYWTKVGNAFQDSSSDSVYVIEYSGGKATLVGGKIVGDIHFKFDPAGNFAAIGLDNGGSYSGTNGLYTAKYYVSDPFIAQYLLRGLTPSTECLKFICPDTKVGTSPNMIPLGQLFSVNLFNDPSSTSAIKHVSASFSQSSNLTDSEIKVDVLYYTTSSTNPPADVIVSGQDFRNLEVVLTIKNFPEWLVYQSY